MGFVEGSGRESIETEEKEVGEQEEEVIVCCAQAVEAEARPGQWPVASIGFYVNY